MNSKKMTMTIIGVLAGLLLLSISTAAQAIGVLESGSDVLLGAPATDTTGFASQGAGEKGQIPIYISFMSTFTTSTKNCM